MHVSIITDDIEVSIERVDVVTVSDAVHTLFYALSAVGYTAPNIAEAFVEVGEEYCEVLGLND